MPNKFSLTLDMYTVSEELDSKTVFKELHIHNSAGLSSINHKPTFTRVFHNQWKLIMMQLCWKFSIVYPFLGWVHVNAPMEDLVVIKVEFLLQQIQSDGSLLNLLALIQVYLKYLSPTDMGLFIMYGWTNAYAAGQVNLELLVHMLFSFRFLLLFLFSFLFLI